MRQSMLTDEQAQFLREEKETLTSFMLKMAEISTPEVGRNAPKDAQAALQQAILQLDELFLLVFVGEFNAGKSALINAILGQKVLAEGVTPTTSRVTLVKWGEQVTERVVDEGYAVVTDPLPLLRELNIVDSPGTNAIIRQHERLTDEFVPRSDLVLFTTSADRPMTESERQFLERILAWGKKVVFVLNKIDTFQDEAALQEVQGYILKNAAAILGEAPELFPVSARLAQQAALESDEAACRQMRSASRMDALEQYIDATLDDTSRLRLKFQNPLGVADNLLAQSGRMVQAQSVELAADLQTTSALEDSVAGYERDLGLELAPRLAEVENVLHRVELKGLDFFDRTLRLTNIHHLVRGDRIRADFEKEVLAGMSEEIDDRSQRLIDWLVEKDLHEWQRVMSYLQRRQALNLERVVGGGLSPQASSRRDLIDTVGRNVKAITDGYNKTREAGQLAIDVEAAVAQTALFEAGAVGLGALVSSALLSSALDITGTIAAGTLAIVGLFVIPYKRKKAREDFRRKMTALRTNLNETLTATFRGESADALSRLRDNIAPYTRSVRAEQERILKAESLLAELQAALARLRARVDTVLK